MNDKGSFVSNVVGTHGLQVIPNSTTQTHFPSTDRGVEVETGPVSYSPTPYHSHLPLLILLREHR